MEKDSRPETTFDPRCGTYAGSVRHSKLHEKPCEPCRMAKNEYRRKNQKPRTNLPITREKCGTTAGYKAHEARGEFTCDPCRIAINEVVRLRNEKIKDLRALKSRQYRANNPDHVKAVEKAWREANPEKKKAKDLNRYARKKNAPIVEFVTRQQVLDKWGSDCHICHKPIDLEANRQTNPLGLQLDHVVALANGGTHTLDNIKPSHVFCNLSKGAK
jgi:HNH endonuclease